MALSLRFAIPLCAALASMAAAPAGADYTETPFGWLYEAEGSSNAGQTRDANASNGAASRSDRPWQPLAVLQALPEGLPERFEVWTRRKGGPVCLKALAEDGGQSEIAWTWGDPVRWTWQKCAEIGRGDAPGGLLVIKDGGSAETALDAVALVVDAAAAAAAFAPVPQKVGVRISWDEPAGFALTPRHWAFNDYEIVKAGGPDADFNAAFAALAPAFVRVHHAGLSDSWTVAGARDWDYGKIRRAFGDIPAYRGVPLMVNVPSWPKWLGEDPVLPEGRADELADLCARLAVFFQRDLGVRELYLEVLNEREETYERAGRLPELWALLNRIMDAVREKAPGVKVGGPALTWPKDAWVDGYLGACGRNADFLTWHSYASGSRSDPDDMVLVTRVGAIRDMAAGAVRKMSAAGLGDKEAFLSEYNISWTWETRDPRMANNLGAVFDAQVVLAMAEEGLSGAFVWHLKDGIYGLMDGGNALRPAYHLFRIGRRELVGDAVKTEVSDESLLTAAAIRRADGSRAVLLVNRSDLPLEVALDGANGMSGRYFAIGAEGVSEGQDADAGGGKDAPLPLAPYSIRVLFL